MRPLCIFLLLCSTAVLAADRYWLVGEFDSRQGALRQAERISGAAGVEVWLQPEGEEGSIRLLIREFSDEIDRARLKTQLRHVGVDSPRPVELKSDIGAFESVFSVVGASRERLPAPAAAATRLSGYMLIVGSFEDDARAERQRAQLADRFQVRVLEGTADGKRLHRVAIGPHALAELNRIRKRLAKDGIEDAWLLRYTSSALVERLVEEKKDAAESATAASETEPGYNPAKLRRGRNPLIDHP